jgi:hypothetical protein
MDPTMTPEAPGAEAPEMDANHAVGEAIEAAVRVAASKGAAMAGARQIVIDLADDGSITVTLDGGDPIAVTMDEIVAAIDADTAAEMSAPPPLPAA